MKLYRELEKAKKLEEFLVGSGLHANLTMELLNAEAAVREFRYLKKEYFDQDVSEDEVSKK